MIRLARHRKGLKTAPRRWLLLSVMAWLNIALAPCAMAMGDSPACPHGAATAHSETMSHDGHHGGAAADTSTEHCAFAESDCCGDNIVVTETRSQSSAESNPLADVATGYSLVVTRHLATAAVDFADAGPPERFVTSPPLRILNCVYLD